MEKANERLADFLFEVGTMRRLPRIHRQLLLVDDVTDSIASHSYRVTIIGWFLAKLESADPYKVAMMCLLHDLGEIRTGDHNYLHKRYTKTFDSEVRKDQLGSLPFSDMLQLAEEYDERESQEAIIAKDADLLDQILLLKEYEWQGNKEAAIWLKGKGDHKGNAQYNSLKTVSAKGLGQAIQEKDPSDWWNYLWTSHNR